MGEIHRHENGKAPAWEPGPFVYQLLLTLLHFYFLPSIIALIASAVRGP